VPVGVQIANPYKPGRCRRDTRLCILRACFCQSFTQEILMAVRATSPRSRSTCEEPQCGAVFMAVQIRSTGKKRWEYRPTLVRYGIGMGSESSTFDHITFLGAQLPHSRSTHTPPSSAAFIAPIHSDSIPFKSPLVSPQKPYCRQYLHRPSSLLRAVKTTAHATPRQSTPRSGPHIARVAAYGL
jgi:hypothetical protein